MNTTTHVFWCRRCCVSGRSGNTKLHPILSYPILSILSIPSRLAKLIFIQSFLFLKDYRRIKTQKIYVFNVLGFSVTVIFGWAWAVGQLNSLNMFNTPGCQLILNTFKSCRFGDTKCKLLTMINCTDRGERSEGTHGGGGVWAAPSPPAHEKIMLVCVFLSCRCVGRLFIVFFLLLFW